MLGEIKFFIDGRYGFIIGTDLQSYYFSQEDSPKASWPRYSPVEFDPIKTSQGLRAVNIRPVN